jgi:hypothetical protein
MTYEQARQCMVICKRLGTIVGWEGFRDGAHSFWVITDLATVDTVVFSEYTAFMNWAEAYEMTNTRSPEGA